jgi:hypothetical protein
MLSPSCSRRKVKFAIAAVYGLVVVMRSFFGAVRVLGELDLYQASFSSSSSPPQPVRDVELLAGPS